MQFIPIPNCVQAEWIMSFDGQIVENVLHYAGDTDPESNIDETFLENMISQWHDFYRPCCTPQVQLVRVKATILDAQDSQSIEGGVPTSEVGTVGEDALPGNCAVLLSWKTAKRGRSYRGRTYIPGVPDNWTTGAVLQPARVAVYEALAGALQFISGTTGPYGLVIASRFNNGVARTTGVTTPITGVVVQTVVASQRRRLPGRGR